MDYFSVQNKAFGRFQAGEELAHVVILGIRSDQDEQWGSWSGGWEVVGAQTTLKAVGVEGSR